MRRAIVFNVEWHVLCFNCPIVPLCQGVAIERLLETSRLLVNVEFKKAGYLYVIAWFNFNSKPCISC